MLANHVVKVAVVDDVGAGQHDPFLLGAGQIGAVGAQGVQRAGVNADVLTGQEGRKHLQTVVLTVQVPFLAGADMVHQGVVVLLHDNADVLHSAVDHAGNEEVDHTIAAGHGQSGNRAVQRQVTKARIIFAGVNNTHYILHRDLFLSHA